jgi:hypothetical protein
MSSLSSESRVAASKKALAIWTERPSSCLSSPVAIKGAPSGCVARASILRALGSGSGIATTFAIPRTKPCPVCAHSACYVSPDCPARRCPQKRAAALLIPCPWEAAFLEFLVFIRGPADSDRKMPAAAAAHLNFKTRPASTIGLPYSSVGSPPSPQDRAHYSSRAKFSLCAGLLLWVQPRLRLFRDEK